MMAIKELIIDNFAGGGGASTGIEMAIGRSVDVAINHDPAAVAMHRTNHPNTKHYCENVWDVDPREVVKDRPVALVWLSPDCKHFSKAKGGRPVEKHIRGLAWVAVRWAATVRPRVIMLENVEEFKTWGPVIPKRDPETGRMLKLVPDDDETADVRYVVAEPGEVVPYEERVYIPDPKRKGITFKAFINALRRQGYQVDWRELRACDYGAPTIRKRFFLIARRDGRPIIWPKPTHGDPNSSEVKSGKLLPWRTAAEIIDWSLSCKSIFERKRPLAENTMKRIARGIQRFVIENPNPFIIKINHAGEDFRGQSLNEPMQTITAKNGWGMVTPYLAGVGGRAGQSRPRSGNEPMATITTKADVALITPYIARIGQTGFGGDRMQYPIDEPLTTVVSKAEHLLVSPTLIQMGYGEREGQAPRVLNLDKPLGTITAGGNKFAIASALISRQFGKSVGHSMNDPLGTITAGGGGKSQLVTACLVGAGGPAYMGKPVPVNVPMRTIVTENHRALVAAFLAKHYGGNYTGPGADMDEPVPTVTTVDHNALVTSHLIKLRGTCQHGQPVTEPMPTVTAGGLHIGEVQAFLLKYYGTNIGQDCNTPLQTVTTKHRFGLVTVEGQDYQIVDIRMRMLEPHELYAANGFPDSYIIDRNSEGRKFSKAQQVAMCGNSVPPYLPEHMTRVNLPELCVPKNHDRFSRMDLEVMLS